VEISAGLPSLSCYIIIDPITSSVKYKFSERYPKNHETPVGGWAHEIEPKYNIHTLVEIETDQGLVGVGRCYTSTALVNAAMGVLRPDDIDGYVLLREHAPLPISAGEVLPRRQSFLPWIERRALDIVQLDSTKVGGLSEARHIAWMAYDHGVTMVSHGWNTVVGLYAEPLHDYVCHDKSITRTAPSQFKEETTITNGKAPRESLGQVREAIRLEGCSSSSLALTQSTLKHLNNLTLLLSPPIIGELIAFLPYEKSLGPASADPATRGNGCGPNCRRSGRID